MLFLSRSLNHIVMHMLLNLLRIVRTWYKSAHSIHVDMHTKTHSYIHMNKVSQDGFISIYT